jgi:hypothetical protein
MKKIEKISAKIAAKKEIMKAINSHKYYSSSQFISDGERYIKAIEQNRMICSIASVSASGMSRNIKFASMEKGNSIYYLSNYNMLFDILGYKKSKSNDFYFTIGGCGMDMVFHTNYTIIHRLHNLGFFDKNKCSKLAQMTPTII